MMFILRLLWLRSGLAEGDPASSLIEAAKDANMVILVEA
jgi:hypothetical protein